MIIPHSPKIILFSLCAFVFSKVHAISSVATAAAAAAQSSNGAKQGMVLFGSAQQLEQQKMDEVAGTAVAFTQPLVSSPGSLLESRDGLEPQPPPVVGEITVINGQVDSSRMSANYAPK